MRKIVLRVAVQTVLPKAFSHMTLYSDTNCCKEAAIQNKRRHVRVAFPAVIIPIVMTPVSQIDDCQQPWAKHVSTAVFFVISILNAITTYFDYLENLYMNTSHKFSEIVADIEFELSNIIQRKWKCCDYEVET